MTRPQIVRADTIDLQDHHSPSAQDHTHPHSSPTSGSSLAPHQAEALRGVAADIADETSKSPRVSWSNSAEGTDLQLYAQDLTTSVANTMQQQDALAIAQNGGHPTEETEMDDIDDGLEEDMMDKISSSPSIEDGGSKSLEGPWPVRRASQNPFVAIPSLFQHNPTSTRLSRAATSGSGRDVGLGSPTVASSEVPPATLQSCASEELPSRDELPLSDSACEISHPPSRRGDTNNSQPLASLFRDVPPAAMARLRRRGSLRFVTMYNMHSRDKAAKKMPCADSASSSEDKLASQDSSCDPHPLQDYSFIDSGWEGSSLHDLEDIDFEFVYALHTFVATVEGQANATKGDTMVLLDDSNSYWWLVRVVKDQSIGYLPAEHIETPTERLARLNKHRNIDLSATMLGDQAEKPKNILKTAMRKRKKTVTFTEPTIHAYSDFDYSSEEEDLDNEYFAQAQQQQQQQQQQRQQLEQQDQQQLEEGDLEDESARVQPLNMRSQSKDASLETGQDDNMDPDMGDGVGRTSDELAENSPEPSRSRNGTVRNTDSFFKDETLETKKITLTPNLLRDDNEARASSESNLRSRPSLDKLSLLERDPEKGKDDKKKKEKDKKEKDKKPSVIRSLFSRGKDKKKSAEDDDDVHAIIMGKRSLDIGSSGNSDISQEKVSEEIQYAEDAPQRHAAKLQKQQPVKSNGANVVAAATATAAAAAAVPVTMRMVGGESKDEAEGPQNSRAVAMEEPVGPSSQDTGIRAVALLQSTEEVDEPESNGPKNTATNDQKPQRPTLPGSFPDSYTTTASTPGVEETQEPFQQPRERLSESPVQVSPVNMSNPPALVGDTSSQEATNSSPISSPSPELVELDEEVDVRHRNQDSVTTSSPTTGAGAAAGMGATLGMGLGAAAGAGSGAAAWNDANLRAFFDSGSDVRDMLAVVYDKSDVKPVGPDHPLVAPLFKEQNAKLAEITNQLDNMLGDWLARKQRLRGTL